MERQGGYQGLPGISPGNRVFLNNMRDYLRLFRFVKPYWALFAAAVFCMAISALFDGVSLAMMVPLADKVMTNKQIILPGKVPGFLADFVVMLNGMPQQTLLNYLAVFIIVLFFLKEVFTFLQSYLMSDLGQRVIRDIRSLLYSKFHSLSLDYFTHKRGGEMISRITNDVRLVENAVSYGSTDLVYQSLQVVIFAVMAFFIYAKLALIILVICPLISFPIIKVGRVLRKLSRRGQEKMADINSLLYETIIGARIVKAFNMEEYEKKRFAAANQDYFRISMKSIKRTLILSPATEFLGCLAGVFVFFWGGREVIAGKLSFGILGLFLASLLSLIRPFKKLSAVNSLNQQAVAAGIRIYEVLDAVPSIAEKPGAVEMRGLAQGIEFNGVHFAYDKKKVINNVSFKVSKGEVVAVVGPSGAGKTTLLDLLPRFYDPQQGSILIDGRDTRDFSIVSLRSNIGIVSQETILFNDTIKANISYGQPQASFEQVIAAATQACAHDFIMRFPKGYDTVIGDRGMMISGGERQRLAIARALLKNPPILILDEATSQLDAESERLVQQAIDRLISGRTVLLIAHRLSTVRHADRIIALENGRIVEIGTHEELIKNTGLYNRLCRMQELAE
jgi:subfamily B ATP-binding cassette protein MsbA